MATAEQLKSLIRSHLSDDEERFMTVALQVAAHEAVQGHGALAHDIRDIVDKARRTRGPNVLLKFPQELSGLVLSERADIPLAALVLSEPLIERIRRVIHEHRQQEKLKSHGLGHRRKLLLAGPPGTGKTMTARVLAHELKMPLHTIQVDRLVTKFMGETGAKLRTIFDLIRDVPGVYLFDEFDAIAGDRALDNDVGEMRRVLNALLQFIEQDASDSLIIGATNNLRLLDKALFRRFDDVLHFVLPDDSERKTLITNVLGTFRPRTLTWKSIVTACSGLSHAEIDMAVRDAVKDAILHDRKTIQQDALMDALNDRRSAQPV
ncbi:AAA family ATPase [Prosthecobacter sp.]|uniref:AAA family ATPase n=1 Tax=Prosthecobacter sp. TaxID=1965333 RepID=UPI003784CD3C